MAKIDTTSKNFKRIFRLVFSALMIALGTALSVVSIGLPWGGSITAGSMVPMILLCRMYGIRWGAFSCTAYALLQLLLGLDNFSYATTVIAILAIAVFDYILAYGGMCVSGIVKKGRIPALSAAFSAFLACLVRFICHFICGYVVWSQWADVTALPTFLQNTTFAEGNLLLWSYSFFYNLSYMLPETIITVVLCAIILPLSDKWSLSEAK